VARVLIGWELGANRGHIGAIERIAVRLLDEGHEVALALQQVDAVGTHPDPRLTVWQAPIWSRLLTSGVQPNTRAVTTMGDILCRLGLDKPGMLAALVRGWDRIFAAFEPDLVVADFAPAMLAAAHGRTRSVQTGTGYACPPPQAPVFPRLVTGPAAYDEADMLDIADADLRSVGREPLPGLPALFASDHSLIASFPVLDPYAASRPGSHCAPAMSAALPQSPGGNGDEIFVYLYHQVPADAPVWEGLAQTGRKVRVHMSDAHPEHLARCRALELAFETHPLAFTDIAARSRIALSHGGHGFVSSCLASGLPQIVAWYDLEKRLYGQAAANAKLGAETNLFATRPAQLAAAIDRLCTDAAIRARCAAMAIELAAQPLASVEDRIVQIAASA
jgi:rhamnosyltransferase subunit B